MQYMNFEYLIRKYSREFTVITYSDDTVDKYGEVVKGKPTKTKLFGAIISHRQNKIFRSEGTLTEQDRALYMLEPLDKALVGATVIDEGKEYKIVGELQNATFTGVYSYSLKYLSAFDSGGEAE